MNSFNNKDNIHYRQLIVNHYSNPINKGLLKSKESYSFHHFQNSCVDDYFVELTFNDDIVTNARFDGVGCAISLAAVDIFELLITNKTIKQVTSINKNYKDMLAGKEYNQEILQDLNAFKNVLKQPARLKCALIISQSIDEILAMKETGK